MQVVAHPSMFQDSSFEMKLDVTETIHETEAFLKMA